MGDFAWRASVAEVDSDAPFSRFPGIDRQIVLLDGTGFRMTLDDGQTHELTTPFAPFAFAGECEVAVSLVRGPTRDFNLMVRRGPLRGELQVWRAPGPWSLADGIVLVHAARGRIDTARGPLLPGDSWLAGAAPAGTIVLHDDALALAVRITRAG